MHGPLSGVDKGLQTDSLLQKAAMKMPKAMVTSKSVDRYRTGIAPDGTGFTMPITIQTVDTEYLTSFARIGQALLTLLLACVGGLAGRWIQERNRNGKQPGAYRD